MKRSIMQTMLMAVLIALGLCAIFFNFDHYSELIEKWYGLNNQGSSETRIYYGNEPAAEKHLSELSSVSSRIESFNPTDSYTISFKIWQDNKQSGQNSDAIIFKSVPNGIKITLDQRKDTRNRINIYFDDPVLKIFDSRSALRPKIIDENWNSFDVSIDRGLFFNCVTVYINNVPYAHSFVHKTNLKGWIIGAAGTESGFEGKVSEIHLNSGYISPSDNLSRIREGVYSSKNVHTVEKLGWLIIFLSIAVGSLLLKLHKSIPSCRSVIAPVGIFLYLGLLLLQLNLYPYERYPNWDFFWADVRTGAILEQFKLALSQHTIPLYTPFTSLGYNLIGDHYPIATIPNLIAVMFDAQTALYLIQFIFLLLGQFGVFFYTNSIVNNRRVAYLASIYYVSTTYVLSNFYYFHVGFIFYTVPFVLYLINRHLQSLDKLGILSLFIFFFAFAPSGGLYGYVVITPLLLFYTFAIAHFCFKIPVTVSVKQTLLIVSVFIGATSFYLIPLLENIYTISTESTAIRMAVSVAESNISFGAGDFVRFFIDNMSRSLALPYETTGGGLYAPSFFYAFILCYFILLFIRPRYCATAYANNVVILICCAVMMPLLSVMFYSPLMPAKIRSAASGVLRYHIALVPFFITVAGFLSVNKILNTSHDKKVLQILSIFVAICFVYEIFIFVLLPYCTAASGTLCSFSSIFSGFKPTPLPFFESSNLFQLPDIQNKLLLIPFFHVFAVLSIVLFLKARKPDLLGLGAIVLALIAPLLNLSLYNDLRLQQNSVSDVLSRDSTRIDSYLHRRNCVRSIVDTNDLNYRTIYVGSGRFGASHFGRDWSLIAETELHVVDKQNTLFSYREFDHPFMGIIYKLFTGIYKSTNTFPPLATQAFENPDVLKFLGVKWIISASKVAPNDEFVYLGSCEGQEGFYDILEPGESNTNLYVYRLRNPNAIGHLSNNYVVQSREDSIHSVLEKLLPFMKRDVVGLEESPGFELNGVPCIDNCSLTVNSADFNEIQLTAHTDKPAIATITYIYGPQWEAYVNGHLAKIYRADGGLIAIPIPQGHSHILLKYSNNLFFLGVVLTIATFFSILLMCRFELSVLVRRVFKSK